MNTTSGTAGAANNRQNKQPAVPCNKKTFQRFFEIKMQIKQKLQDQTKREEKVSARELKKRLSKQRSQGIGSRSLMKAIAMENSRKYEMMYNLNNVDMSGEWSRIILFTGEGASFVQTSMQEVLYSGGFMGTQYNYKIAAFTI